MTDDNLAYHADNVLKSPAFLYVMEKREKDILDQLLAVKGWRPAVVEAKRKELLDDLAAIRRIKTDLEMLARVKQTARPSYTA